jgi:protein-S-isoprenylcysteine O-methyltransferase Ste14
MAIGVTLLVMNAILVRWAFVTMRTAQTSPNPFESSTALVVTGPFKFSRNPVYVAMTGFYCAIALLINSLWPLLLLLPLVVIMHRGVIRREELYLEQRFGAAYGAYKMRVRRWL